MQGDFPHGTTYEISRVAWPELKTLPPLADTDNDGMPDEWEFKNQLDPFDHNDASAYKLSKQYTNVEVYLDEIIKKDPSK